MNNFNLLPFHVLSCASYLNSFVRARARARALFEMMTTCQSYSSLVAFGGVLTILK